MSIILPMIKKTLPVLVAEELVGTYPIPYNKKYWPYQYTMSYDMVFRSSNNIKDVERWCYANFKSRNWRNKGRYFAFKRHEDYMMFLLRWS